MDKKANRTKSGREKERERERERESPAARDGHRKNVGRSIGALLPFSAQVA